MIKSSKVWTLGDRVDVSQYSPTIEGEEPHGWDTCGVCVRASSLVEALSIGVDEYLSAIEDWSGPLLYWALPTSTATKVRHVTSTLIHPSKAFEGDRTSCPPARRVTWWAIIWTCRQNLCASKKGWRCLLTTVPFDIDRHVCIESSPWLMTK